MEWTTAVTMPVVGAFTGWITNLVAIRMLFVPRNPIRIPFLGWTFQGVLPKYQAEIARTVGEVVEKELLTTEDIVQQLRQPQLRQMVLEAVQRQVENRIQQLPAFIPSSWRHWLAATVGALVQQETGRMLDGLVEQARESLDRSNAVSRMVEEKVKGFDVQRLESLATHVASRELRFIVVFGAVLGFVIGLIQLLLVQGLG